MDALFPDLYILIDLFGMGMALWLGLHLLVHGWGWHRSRAPMAGMALLGAALPAAVAAYRAIVTTPMGLGRQGLLKVLIVPALPLTLLLVRRFAPGAVAARNRFLLGLALIASAVTVGLMVLLGPLKPDLAARQSDALVAFAIATLIALAAIARDTWRARRILRSPPERNALLLIAMSAVLLALGALFAATDLLLSFDGAQVQAWLVRSGMAATLDGNKLRLLGSGLRALAIIGLAIGIVRQARAEAAPHLARLAHATLVTVSLLLLYLAIGGLVVWYFALPRWLMGLFMLLALVTDALDDAARGWMERLLYRGENAATRRTLRHLAEHLAPQAEVPPALRALLVRLARQLGSPQLAYAARHDGKDGKREYKIIAAVRPAWLGKKVEATHPDEWEERPGGGWTFPVQRHKQSVGMLISEETGTLSPVQIQLMREAAAEIVTLLDEWGSTADKRTKLNEALTEYRTHSDHVAETLRLLATPPPAPPDLRRAVDGFLNRYSDSAVVLGGLPLAKLNAVTRVIPPAQATSAEARGNAARIIVQHLVEQLRPMDIELPSTPDDVWLPYLTLTRLHIHNQPRDEFMKEFNLSALRVRRMRGRGIEQIARHLGEMEAAMRQHAPSKEAAPTAAPSAGRTSGAASQPNFGGTALSKPATSAPTEPKKPALGGLFGRKSGDAATTTTPAANKPNLLGALARKKEGADSPKAEGDGSAKKPSFTMPFGRKADSGTGENVSSSEAKKPTFTMPFGRKTGGTEGETAPTAEPKKPSLPWGRKPSESSDAPTATTKAVPDGTKSLKERFTGAAGGLSGALKRGADKGDKPTSSGTPAATLPTGSRARPAPKPSPSAQPAPPPSSYDDEDYGFDDHSY